MLPEPPLTYNDTTGMWTVDAEVCVPSLGYCLVVPKGFVTDLASIPRVFWSEIAPFQLSIAGPLVHDWLYEHGGQIATRVQGQRIRVDQTHTFSRAQADAFLRDIAEQHGVPAWRCNAAYYAVRWFGASNWQP